MRQEFSGQSANRINKSFYQTVCAERHEMLELADVVIVGGGLVGAALACEWTKKTPRVVLIEKGRCGKEASGGSFGWVNASSKYLDENYHRLNALGVARYSALATEWDAGLIGWHGGGALYWAKAADSSALNELHKRTAALQQMAYPAVPLNSDEMRALEPNVSFGDSDVGLFTPSEGWIETSRLIRCLLDSARSRGGEVNEYTEAVEFTRDRTNAISTVVTTTGRIATRTVILAAGLQTPALLSLMTGEEKDRFAGLIKPVPGLLFETRPAAGSIHRVLYPPDSGGLHLRPTAEGGILLGADDSDDLLTGEQFPGMDSPGIANFHSKLGASLLKRAANSLPGMKWEENISPGATRICVRPMPFDGLPIVGAVEDVRGAFILATHSGITLGPLLAHLMTEEIAAHRPIPLLDRYRMGRFMTEKVDL